MVCWVRVRRSSSWYGDDWWVRYVAGLYMLVNTQLLFFVFFEAVTHLLLITEVREKNSSTNKSTKSQKSLQEGPFVMTRAMKTATLLLGLGMAVILCICKSEFSLHIITCVRLITHKIMRGQALCFMFLAS